VSHVQGYLTKDTWLSTAAFGRIDEVAPFAGLFLRGTRGRRRQWELHGPAADSVFRSASSTAARRHTVSFGGW